MAKKQTAKKKSAPSKKRNENSSEIADEETDGSLSGGNQGKETDSGRVLLELLAENWGNIVALLFGGVIGFFSAQLATKDEIKEMAEAVGEMKGFLKGSEGKVDLIEDRLKKANENLDKVVTSVSEFETTRLKELNQKAEGIEQKANKIGIELDNHTKVIEQAVEKIGKKLDAYEDDLKLVAEISKQRAAKEVLQRIVNAPETDKDLLAAIPKLEESIERLSRGLIAVRSINATKALKEWVDEKKRTFSAVDQAINLPEKVSLRGGDLLVLVSASMHTEVEQTGAEMGLTVRFLDSNGKEQAKVVSRLHANMPGAKGLHVPLLLGVGSGEDLPPDTYEISIRPWGKGLMDKHDFVDITVIETEFSGRSLTADNGNVDE